MYGVTLTLTAAAAKRLLPEHIFIVTPLQQKQRQHQPVTAGGRRQGRAGPGVRCLWPQHLRQQQQPEQQPEQ